MNKKKNQAILVNEHYSGGVGGQGAGEVREAGEKRAGSGMRERNAKRYSLHLVCIKIPKEQERKMTFDFHQRLLSNNAKKNSHLV